MESKISRRHFVTALALVGSAMALPKGFSARSLPDPEQVILLPGTPEISGAALPSLVWIDKTPLANAYSFEHLCEFSFHPFADIDSPLRPLRDRGGYRHRFTLRLVGEEFPQIFDYSAGARAEFCYVPGLGSGTGYIFEAARMDSCRLYIESGAANKVNECLVNSEWEARCSPVIVHISELLKHVGASPRRVMLPKARLLA